MKIKFPKLPPIVYIAIALVSIIIATNITHIPIPFTNTGSSICEAAYSLDRITCGEEIILTPPGGLSRLDKQAGFKAIKEKDHRQGIENLEKDFSIAKDPESLVALNNTKLSQNKAVKTKTIAALLPASRTPIFVATSILKGIAQAQEEWNQAGHDWQLRVITADDSNDPNEATKIATELVKHPDILAVIGAYSSNVTVRVKDIYQQAKTVLLSATSTSDELTNLDSNNYFYRVVSSNIVSAKDMAAKWASKYDKIALFYTPNKKFSESLKAAFLSQIRPNTIVKEFDLTSPNNAAQEIAVAKAAGAKALVLFPDAYTDPIERDRVLSVVKANKGELPILANSILQDAYLFQVNPQFLKGLTISVPIHSSDLKYIDVGKFNNAPSWWGEKTQVQDRIINSYDAMQVLLSALDKADDREAVQKALSNPNFNVRGITGKISFRGSDRAENINSLITPHCDISKCNGFKLAF